MTELPEPEIYTPERIAQFLLNNAISKEGWDEAAQEVREMGLDPLKIEYTDPEVRQTLPDRRQLEAIFQKIEDKYGTPKSA